MDAAIDGIDLAPGFVIQWRRFVPGRPAKASYPARASLCYMAFPDPAQAAVFAEAFRSHKFVDSKSGMISKPVIEQAPNQYVPGSYLKKKDGPAAEDVDPQLGTITEDPDYVRFLAVAHEDQLEATDSPHDALPPGVVLGSSSGVRGEIFVTSLMEEVRRRKASGDTSGGGRPGKQSSKGGGRGPSFSRNVERVANGGGGSVAGCSPSNGRKGRAQKVTDVVGAGDNTVTLKPLAGSATPTLMKRMNLPASNHAGANPETSSQALANGSFKKGTSSRRGGGSGSGGRRQNAGQKDSAKSDGVDSRLLTRGRGGSRGRGSGRGSDRPKQRDRNPP